jgi:hypothetical protein
MGKYRKAAAGVIGAGITWLAATGRLSSDDLALVIGVASALGVYAVTNDTPGH